MKSFRRQKAAARWPIVLAMGLAAAAAFFAWAFLVRDNDVSLSDEELREIEAFEEYERRKRAGLV